MQVTFWGVRGSIPSPLSPHTVSQKMLEAHKLFEQSGMKDYEEFLAHQPYHIRSTYGGNTSCVEIMCGKTRIVCDMGTGLRNLGNSLFPEMMAQRGIDITFLLSHLHWDHIQGLPFFGPLYMNKNAGICNSWHFYGGSNWAKGVEQCLQGQMDAPTFPVSWREIKKITAHLKQNDVCDLMSFSVGDAYITARKLNHPQETYGWRIQYEDAVVVYATDNEPYDPLHPDPRLVSLAADADLLIIDCQYNKETYEGKNGPPRHGWGHSYPDAVARVAVEADVKQMALFHHDPASSDAAITEMRDITQHIIHQLGGKTSVIASYEGLVLPIEAK